MENNYRKLQNYKILHYDYHLYYVYENVENTHMKKSLQLPWRLLYSQATIYSLPFSSGVVHQLPYLLFKPLDEACSDVVQLVVQSTVVKREYQLEVP